jgi:hypothetical protein
MWSKSTRSDEEKKEETSTITDVARNVRFIHMQIDSPKTGKTRAQKVKEALMIIFATSKHIKLHPKEEGKGEIIDNIDDMVTTEEFTNQYFFDKKLGGKRYVRGQGVVEYYSTKVRLETDIGLTKMKWHTSPKFIEALKMQNIYLKEYQDGVIMRTGNIGWLSGLNPANTSTAKVTKDLNRILKKIDATAIIDIHTVSIRFPQTKKAFVTRAYKVMCNVEKIEEARKILGKELKGKKMGVGWEKVSMVNFNVDKNTTAMMIEAHNKQLHNTAVVAIKNIWSITEADREMTKEEKNSLGMDVEASISTIEEMWWHLADRYQHDIQGMVTRRGTLEILTTRSNLNDTVGFARELVSNTLKVIGEDSFAKKTANHNIQVRQPEVQNAPMILSGTGKVRLDTNLFTEEEFKVFASKHGIPLGGDEERKVDEVVADLTRPPRAMYHKPGREPVEQDPRKMREGALKIWENFTEKAKKKIRNTIEEAQEEQTKQRNQETQEKTRHDTTSEEIARQGKMLRLENTIKNMKESQMALEASTTKCQKKIMSMQETTKESMDQMSEMINNMGESITVQNRQLEAQAKVQLKQAEDIERIMKAIQAISNAVQVTPDTTQQEEGTSDMQIDIAESNKMKRKQHSLGSTTPFTEKYGSTITSLKAKGRSKEMNGTEEQ